MNKPVRRYEPWLTFTQRAAVSLVVAFFLATVTAVPTVHAHGGQPHASEEAEILSEDKSTTEEGDQVVAEEEEVTGTAVTILQVRLENSDNGLIAQGLLTDSMGMPLKGLPVRFYRKTTFGQFLIGPVNTDASGKATVTVPATAGQVVEVLALFKGNKTYAPSEARASLELPAAPSTSKRPPGGLTTSYPNPYHVLLLGLVVGAVWVTYGRVVYILIRIKRAGRAAEAEAIWATK